MFTNALQHLHPIFNHFPIALFVTSVGFDLLAWWRPQVRVNGWPLLWIAALMAVPTTITGLIAHIPYENTDLPALPPDVVKSRG